MEKKIPKILFVKRDACGCGYYRCEQPAKYIAKMGLAETKIVLNIPTNEDLNWADLVIMQEMGSINASNISRYCIDNHIPYITEFDDFIHHVSPNNVSGYGAWNPGTLLVHRSMQQARTGFAITVSTNQLAKEYFPYHPLIYVIPNYIDKELWDQPVVKRSTDKIKIGWSGGNAHADDLHMISKVMEKITKEFKGKVIFETMGMTNNELKNVFDLKKFEETCPVCNYEGEINHFPGETIQNHPVVLAAKGWDIGLAPVINNSFGNCKSDLKLKEYAALGIPFVASNIIPYKEAINSGACGVLAETFDEWYNGIKGLIKNHKKREEIAKINKEWVSQYWVQDNAQKIFEVYQQIISRAELVFSDKIIK